MLQTLAGRGWGCCPRSHSGTAPDAKGAELEKPCSTRPQKSERAVTASHHHGDTFWWPGPPEVPSSRWQKLHSPAVCPARQACPFLQLSPSPRALNSTLGPQARAPAGSSG